jgi:hypothetical protein
MGRYLVGRKQKEMCGYLSCEFDIEPFTVCSFEPRQSKGVMAGFQPRIEHTPPCALVCREETNLVSEAYMFQCFPVPLV